MSKPQIYCVVRCSSKTEAVIAKKINCTTKRMVVKEIKLLVAVSLDNIQQCANENEHTDICSIIYKVVEHVVRYPLRNEVIGKTLDSIIITYFDTYKLAKLVEYFARPTPCVTDRPTYPAQNQRSIRRGAGYQDIARTQQPAHTRTICKTSHVEVPISAWS